MNFSQITIFLKLYQHTFTIYLEVLIKLEKSGSDKFANSIILIQ